MKPSRALPFLFAFPVAAALFTGALTALGQELSSVAVHVGTVDLDAIVSGEKRLPLVEPVVETEPSFDPSTKSYRVRIPYGANGVTLVGESGFMSEVGMIDFNGAGGQFNSVTYQLGGLRGEGRIVSFDLEPGWNHLRMGVRESLSSTVIYEFFMERPERPSETAALAALRLGGGELSPAFEPDIRIYRTRIDVSNSLTVTPTANAGSSVIVLGAAADGAQLGVRGNIVTGLTAGDNLIAMVVDLSDRDKPGAVHIAAIMPDGGIFVKDAEGGVAEGGWHPWDGGALPAAHVWDRLPGDFDVVVFGRNSVPTAETSEGPATITGEKLGVRDGTIRLYIAYSTNENSGVYNYSTESVALTISTNSR